MPTGGFAFTSDLPIKAPMGVTGWLLGRVSPP